MPRHLLLHLSICLAYIVNAFLLKKRTILRQNQGKRGQRAGNGSEKSRELEENGVGGRGEEQGNWKKMVGRWVVLYSKIRGDL